MKEETKIAEFIKQTMPTNIPNIIACGGKKMKTYDIRQ
jgi:hypothetical protein